MGIEEFVSAMKCIILKWISYVLQYALYITFEWPFDFTQVRAFNLLHKLFDDCLILSQFLMFFWFLFP